MIRNPAAAGQFYSAQKSQLLEEVKSLIGVEPKQKIDSLGVLSPHAGFIYSGPVAALTLASIKPKPTYIIIGPNHTGLGAEFGISTSTAWRTPLGDVKINSELAERIKANSSNVRRDEMSCFSEHSIEVQLPFLQALQKEFTFVPMVASYANIGVYKEIGKSVAKAVKEMKLEKDVTIIASSDMTHYESRESASKKDSAAIEAILELDEDKLAERIAKMDITMCGYAPAVIMLVAAKELGAKSSKLIKYQTSGDTSGDYSSVVGYAGVVIC